MTERLTTNNQLSEPHADLAQEELETEEERWLDVKHAAEFLDVDLSQVYRLIGDGKLEAEKRLMPVIKLTLSVREDELIRYKQTRKLGRPRINPE